MRVQAAPLSHLAWLMARTGLKPTEDCRAIEALDGKGCIRGMVAYDAWTENSCQAHMAVAHPIVWRHLLRPAFEYPFTQCGKGLVLGVVRATNLRSMTLTRHLGFVETHRIRDGYALGADMVVFEMRKADCRWLAPAQRKAA